MPRSHREHSGGIAHVGERLALGDEVDPGVARGGDDGRYVGIGAQAADEGVFAGTGPDDEDLHTPTLGPRAAVSPGLGGRASGRRCTRLVRSVAGRPASRNDGTETCDRMDAVTRTGAR